MKIEYIENKDLQTEIKTFIDSPQQVLLIGVLSIFVCLMYNFYI